MKVPAIGWIEDTLIKHPNFALPGKKELLKSDVEYEILAVDGTETSIERPKKSRKDFIQEKKEAYDKNTSSCSKRKQYVLRLLTVDFRVFKESKVINH